MVRDIDRLDKQDQIRINGVLTRFQLLQDPSKPTTKYIAIVPKGIKPDALRKEVDEANGKRKVPFQFEPFALQFEAKLLQTFAEDLVNRANRMVHCPGTINDSGSGCTPKASPEDFVQYIEKIYKIAEAYLCGVSPDKQVPNLWLMHWLWRIDYADWKFAVLIRDIDRQ